MTTLRVAFAAAILPALAMVGGCTSTAGNDATGDARDVQGEALAACLTGQVIPAGSTLNISTTVSPVTSMVANVAGGLAKITGLVPEGTNSHTFEPSPSMATTLAQADVFFANGLTLEENTIELARTNLPPSAGVCELGTAVLPVGDYIYDFSFPEEGGKPNPHLWTNPKLAVKYVMLIRDVLVKMDPSNAEAYTSNAASYTTKLEALSAAVTTATATLPASDRKLLTYHDAYAYFANDYGWQVLGAMQPSDFDEPTPREVSDLINQVKNSKVKAIFGSEVFPSPVLEQVGRETGATYVDVLRDDDLPGEPGDADHSFLGLMKFDYVTMVEALGGDASALKNLDVTDVAPDKAVYSQ